MPVGTREKGALLVVEVVVTSTYVDVGVVVTSTLVLDSWVVMVTDDETSLLLVEEDSFEEVVDVM